MVVVKGGGGGQWEFQLRLGFSNSDKKQIYFTLGFQAARCLKILANPVNFWVYFTFV